MAHKHILDVPLHCSFLAAPVRWKIEKLSHTGEEPWFRPHLPRRMKAKTIDPWKARDRFLRLPLDPTHPRAEKAQEELLYFLNEVGLWEQPQFWEAIHEPKSEYQEAILDTGHLVYGHPSRDLSFFRESRWLLTDLMDNNSTIKGLYLSITHPRGNWREAERVAGRWDIFPLTFNWENSAPHPAVTTLCFWHAVLLSLHIDLARGAIFRNCVRPDCGIPYPVLSRHKRKYCSQYCGHIESLRRRRATWLPRRIKVAGKKAR